MELMTYNQKKWGDKLATLIQPEEWHGCWDGRSSIKKLQTKIKEKKEETKSSEHAWNQHGWKGATWDTRQDWKSGWKGASWDKGGGSWDKGVLGR